MTGRRVALVLGLLSSAGLLAACNAILGYEEGDEVTHAAGGAAGSHHTGAGGAGGTTNTGGAGAVGGSGAQGASVGDENCLNGIDDNDDQLADCADPLCTGAGFACLETSTGQALGFALSRPASSPAATCPAGFSLQTLYYEMDRDDLTCTCGCDDPGYPSCTWSGTLYTGAGCTGSTVPMTLGCETDMSAYASYDGVVGMNVPGACQPTVSSAGEPDAWWWSAYDICVADPGGAGCAANSVCAPPPPQGFAVEACTVVPDGGSCESPYELLATLGSIDILDERICTTSGCTCGTAQGQTCVVDVGPDIVGDDCIQVNWSPDPLGPCTAISANHPSLNVEPPVGKDGACPAWGSGTEQGEPYAAEEFSLCCLPTPG